MSATVVVVLLPVADDDPGLGQAPEGARWRAPEGDHRRPRQSSLVELDVVDQEQ